MRRRYVRRTGSLRDHARDGYGCPESWGTAPKDARSIRSDFLLTSTPRPEQLEPCESSARTA